MCTCKMKVVQLSSVTKVHYLRKQVKKALQSAQSAQCIAHFKQQECRVMWDIVEELETELHKEESKLKSFKQDLDLFIEL